MKIEDYLILVGLICLFAMWKLFGIEEVQKLVLSTIVVSTVFYFIFSKIYRKMERERATP